jgi:NIPSNAP
MATYCVARIVIRYGKIAEFVDVMSRLVPIMEDNGWKLLASYQTIIGNVHEAWDIWELPDANAVGAGLAAAVADPRFHDLMPELTAAIESETLTVVVKTPFSP